MHDSAFDQPPCRTCGANRDRLGRCEPYPDPQPTGVITQTGWIKAGDGKDVFRAMVDYPNGPPENLTPDVVFKSLPVEIVVVA